MLGLNADTAGRADSIQLVIDANSQVKRQGRVNIQTHREGEREQDAGEGNQGETILRTKRESVSHGARGEKKNLQNEMVNKPEKGNT